jgi:hypothetical protein
MKQLDNLMEKFLQLIENTQSFVGAELPDYIQQLLLYKAWEYEFGILIVTLAFIASLGIFLVAFAVLKKNGGEIEDSPLAFILSLVSGIITFILLIAGSASIATNIANLQQIKMAPKVYIVDYLSDKIRK